MRPAIGIDVGGTSVHGIVVASDGTVVAEHTEPTVPGELGIRDSITAMVERLAPHDRGPIGVGVPGLVDRGTVRHAVNLGIGASPVDLTTTLRTLTDDAVAVENDVKAAALGARPWLATSEPDVVDYALLNVGTGLAAGLVLDGTLRRGLAGEIGHLTFDRTGPECGCGRRGCLELYASGSGLRRSWAGTAAELFEAASTDPRAAAAAEDLVAGLAHAIGVLTYAVDVQRILVTGGVVSATPALREAVLERLLADGRTPVGRAADAASKVRWLPADAPVGALGAALLATEAHRPERSAV